MAPKRPKSVPKEATYFPDWDEWGVGKMVDGKMEGDWKLWRGDGTFVEESPWKNGKTHGEKRRYHDDGTLSSIATYVDGALKRQLLYRTKKKTREPNFEALPKIIHEIEFLYSPKGDGWCSTQRFRTKSGKEVEINGKPVPPRPASVPELGYFNADDGHWVCGEWHTHGRRGLYRYWDPKGELFRLEYYDGDETAIFDRRPDEESEGSVLMQAVRAKDDAAVAICIEAGACTMNLALHAAWDGLPDVAKRIPKGEPIDPPAKRGDIPGDAVWVPSMDRWVIGRYHERTGRAEGTWKAWWAPEGYTFVTHEQADFTDGRRASFRKYAAEKVEEETLYDEHGKETRVRKWEDGVMEETENRADGTVARRRHYESGKLRAERIVNDGALVHETWFAEDGSKRLEVSPSTEEIEPDEDDEDDDGEEAVEACLAFDDKGLLVAEGFARPGLDGRAIGVWKVDGGKADFGLVTIDKSESLGDRARTLRAWQAHKPPASLKGIDKVPWKKLETFFGDAANFPFYLRGLTVPDPSAVEMAVQHLWDPVLHQGTISDAAAPVYRTMTAVVPGIAHAEALAYALDFMTAIATREGDIDSANRHKQLYVEKPKAGRKHFEKNGVEGAYFDVCDSITQTTKAWARLAEHPDSAVRAEAIVLLALSADPKAERALVDRLGSETDAALRAEILLALALHPPKREAIEPLLASEDRRLRVAAALTWIRTHVEPYDPAARVLLECLGGPDIDDWGDLYLGTGDAKSDAAATLTLLPPKESAAHLDALCGTLATTDGRNAVAVAGALLPLVMDEWEEGDKLNDVQRRVLGAIAESEPAWQFNVNLAEVLSDAGLPGDREALRALLRGKKAPPKAGTQILSAFGGPAGGVSSFQRKKKKKR